MKPKTDISQPADTYSSVQVKVLSISRRHQDISNLIDVSLSMWSVCNVKQVGRECFSSLHRRPERGQFQCQQICCSCCGRNHICGHTVGMYKKCRCCISFESRCKTISLEMGDASVESTLWTHCIDLSVHLVRAEIASGSRDARALLENTTDMAVG